MKTLIQLRCFPCKHVPQESKLGRKSHSMLNWQDWSVKTPELSSISHFSPDKFSLACDVLRLQWNIWCFKSAAHYKKCESAYTCIMFKRLWERLVGWFFSLKTFVQITNHLWLFGMLYNDRFCSTQDYTFIPTGQISQATECSVAAARLHSVQKEGKSDLIRALVLHLWLFCDSICPKRTIFFY